jgi:beta-lactamase regulating signal transducer with metallopeptidase domain
MASDLLFLLVVSLLKAELAIAAAIVVVFMLRPVVRPLSADAAYGLWALVPLAGLMSFFPTRADVFTTEVAQFRLVFHGTSTEAFWTKSAPLLLAAWLVGTAAFVIVLTFSEHRFRRLAKKGEAGPAVVGVGWMRLVTPSDYVTQFTELERTFVRRHERAHILRDDPLANLVIVVIQVISWFNPLVYLAAPAARMDQELACDQAVVREHPDCRRAYAETLLKAQLVGRLSPLACAWAPWGRHPLELRLRMLARRPHGDVRRHLGGGVVALAALAVATGVWLAEPQCALQSSFNGKANEDRSVALSPTGPLRSPPFLINIKLVVFPSL